MKDNVIYYSVGALLYCPANKESVADSIINEKFGNKFSLALCLEDTINDDFVAESEVMLIESIKKICTGYREKQFFLPKIFIRVRDPKQIVSLVKRLKENIEIVSGFIVPKFNLENAKEYINEIILANELSKKKLYMMPIYENSAIIDMRYRVDILYSLKDLLSQIDELVLNIRVGGNDLCHMFGFRRHGEESIYNIKAISNIFSDIITVYGK